MSLTVQMGTTIAIPSACTLDVGKVSIVDGGWCWAACVDMVEQWDIEAGSNLPYQDQRTLVELADTNGYCSTTGCADGLAASRVLYVWGLAGYPNVDEISGQILERTLCEEICHTKRPVEVWFGKVNPFLPDAGTGHIVLVVGRSFDSSQGNVFTVHDPNPIVDQATYSYAGLQKPTGYDGWVGTWLIHR